MKPTDTFAEKSGKPAFNWRKALKKVISRNQKTSPSLTEASKSWVTCACGNQCSVIPRAGAGEPRDNLLARLGVTFYENVKGGAWQTALDTLDEIEKRSALLINVIHDLDKTKNSFSRLLEDAEKEVSKLDYKRRLALVERDRLIEERAVAMREVGNRAKKYDIKPSSVNSTVLW